MSNITFYQPAVSSASFRGGIIRFGMSPEEKVPHPDEQAHDALQLRGKVETNLLASWLVDVPVIQPVKDGFLLTDNQAQVADGLLKVLPRAVSLNAQLEKSNPPHVQGTLQMELAGLRYTVAQICKFSPTMAMRLQAGCQGEAFTKKDLKHLMGCYGDMLEKYPQPFIYLLEEARRDKPLSPEEDSFLSGFLALYQLVANGKKADQPVEPTPKLADAFKKGLAISEQHWTEHSQNGQLAAADTDVDYLKAQAKEKLKKDQQKARQAHDDMLNKPAFRDPVLGDITGLRMLNIIQGLQYGAIFKSISIGEIQDHFPNTDWLTINRLLEKLLQEGYLDARHKHSIDVSVDLKYITSSIGHYKGSIRLHTTGKAKKAIEEAKQI